MNHHVAYPHRNMDTSRPTAEERSATAPSFTESEALLLCDVFNGGMFDHDWMDVDFTRNPVFRWAVEDAIRLDGLDLKWNVDGKALCRRMEILSPAEVSSTMEAIRRFWTLEAGGAENPTLREAVHLAGLCRGGV